MTKINKLGKSTFVIAILSFLLVAVLAFGGTYAYFSATSGEAIKAEVTMGKLKLGATSKSESATVAVSTQKIVPNQPVMVGTFTSTVETDINYYARMKLVVSDVTGFAAGHTDGDDTDTQPDCSCPDKLETLLAGVDNVGANWVKADDGFYYIEDVRTSASGDLSVTLNITINPEIGQVSSTHWMSTSVTISLTFEAVQADYIGVEDTNDNDKIEANEIAAAFATAGLNA